MLNLCPGVSISMSSLDPCLLGCDLALAEADQLIRLASDCAGSLDPEIAAVRLRIAALRHEVERLRGMPALPVRRKIHPDRIDLTAVGSPWESLGSCHPGGEQLGGV